MPKTEDGKQDEKVVKIVESNSREYLRYLFTEDELKKIALEMAQETQKAGAAEDEKKAANANFKDRIEKHHLAAKIAAGHIATGFEMRNIDCKKIINYSKNIVTITRMDTGEQIESRGVKDSERQMKIV